MASSALSTKAFGNESDNSSNCSASTSKKIASHSLISVAEINVSRGSPRIATSTSSRRRLGIPSHTFRRCSRGKDSNSNATSSVSCAATSATTLSCSPRSGADTTSSINSGNNSAMVTPIQNGLDNDDVKIPSIKTIDNDTLTISRRNTIEKSHIFYDISLRQLV